MTALPAEDRALSPLTGWTRAHWEWSADRLLDGVAPFASASQAAYHLPGGRPSQHGHRADGLEGFARTFALAAFRASSPGGSTSPSLERYAAGVAAGVEPRSVDAWPVPVRRGQQLVEAASIAIGLWASRASLWDQLEPTTQEQLAAWLGQVSVRDCWRNNWALFPVVVHSVLRAFGAPHRPSEIEQGLDVVDSLALDHGWYADGRAGCVDHYNGWGFAYYTALWCLIDGDRHAPDRAAVVRARLDAFLGEYQLLFDRMGRHLLFGRSLAYRCAGVAPFLAAEVLRATPLSPGSTRRLASGALQRLHLQTPLDAGPLPLGWTTEFLPGVQRYSSPASPYWVAKAFVGLLAPADDPLWAETEKPLAVDGPDFVTPLVAPGMVIASTGDVVRAVGHASRGAHVSDPSARPAYAKLCYSTRTAPNHDRADVDCQVTFVGRARRRLAGIAGDTVTVRDDYRGAQVETLTIVRPSVDLRVHAVQGRRRGSITSGGYALADAAPLPAGVDGTVAWVAGSDGLVAAACSVHGFEHAAVTAVEGVNPLGRYSATPLLVGRVGPHRPRHQAQIFVAASVLGGRELLDDPERWMPVAEVAPGSVTIAWPDGRIDRLLLDPLRLAVDRKG